MLYMIIITNAIQADSFVFPTWLITSQYAYLKNQTTATTTPYNAIKHPLQF